MEVFSLENFLLYGIRSPILILLILLLSLCYSKYAISLPPSRPPSPNQFVPNKEFLQILLKCIQEISEHLRIVLVPPNNPHILMMRAYS